MSIIIKGIDLPKEGEHIIALIKNDGKCSYWIQDTEYGICEPMRTVEAIQISTPHGRLIDGDALMKTYDEESWTGYYCISQAPTILEAER